jgi:hypothetical protein
MNIRLAGALGALSLGMATPALADITITDANIREIRLRTSF